MEEREKEITDVNMSLVDAEFVNIRQSTVRSVEGGHIDMEQVGAMSIDGERIEISQGAACIIRGNDINLNQSISCITAGTNTGMGYSLSPVVLSGSEADIRDSAVGVVAAKNIKAENTKTLLMLAGSVEGNVQTILDWKSALSLGAIIGGVLGFFSLLKKR